MSLCCTIFVLPSINIHVHHFPLADRSQLNFSNFSFAFRFERQLAVDQESCKNPDYHNPFQSKDDAVKRLIRFVEMLFASGFVLVNDFAFFVSFPSA